MLAYTIYIPVVVGDVFMAPAEVNVFKFFPVGKCVGPLNKKRRKINKWLSHGKKSRIIEIKRRTINADGPTDGAREMAKTDIDEDRQR